MTSKIPESLLNKYEVQDINALIEMNSDIGEIMHYQDFLKKTDYVINKLSEGIISTNDCSEELQYREIARQEIARLSGEQYEPQEVIKTVEERTTELEQRENTAASYDELAAAIREGVNSYGQ